MKNFVKILVIFLLVFGSVSVFAGGSSEEIVVGVAGPYTGDLASYGIPTQRAVSDYIEEVNAAGGIQGKMIQVIAEDEQCAPDQAVNVAQKFVDAGAVAVIGHICSGATIAALPTYTEAGIPVISPSATNVSITTSGDYPTFLRTIAHDEKQAELQIDFLNSLGVKSIVALHDKGDYGKGLAEFASAAAEANGIEVLLFEGITPGALDYSAVILKISEANPDAVVFGGYHPEASKLVAQMKSQGLDIPFIAGDGVKDDTFISVAKEDAEGVYATGVIDTTTLPVTARARSAYSDKYGEEPGAFFDNGYAAIQVLIEVLQSSGADADALLSALKSNTFSTTLGDISFNNQGDVEGAGFAVYQVVNGSYERVQ